MRETPPPDTWVSSSCPADDDVIGGARLVVVVVVVVVASPLEWYGDARSDRSRRCAEGRRARVVVVRYGEELCECCCWCWREVLAIMVWCRDSSGTYSPATAAMSLYNGESDGGAVFGCGFEPENAKEQLGRSKIPDAEDDAGRKKRKKETEMRSVPKSISQQPRFELAERRRKEGKAAGRRARLATRA